MNYYQGYEGEQQQQQQQLQEQQRQIDEINAGIAQHQQQQQQEVNAMGTQSALTNRGEEGTYDYSYDYGLQQQQQQLQQQLQGGGSWGLQRNNETSLRELDYCDLLLRGLDNSAAAAGASTLNGNAHPMLPNQLMWATGMGGGPTNTMNMWPQSTQPSNNGGNHSKASNGMSHLDYFIDNMQPRMGQQQQQSQQSHTMQTQQPMAYSSTAAASKPPSKPKSTPSSRTSHLKPSHKPTSISSSSSPQKATSTPSTYLPHSHSSHPEKQIDPLLETLSLSIPSVSLQSLTGNEVIMHIRSKTDDVVTRFLPCVDFLVNCQQELRQGLAIANQRKFRHNPRSGQTATMTPHQFFSRFVAPLPQKFERKNDSFMASHHLSAAKIQLDHLVSSARSAIPQGCDQIKNAFLGGMRENESWGLRKWLSQHGGAGAICNDVEEILRTVKSLKKEEATTIKLAELLRPIAGQAHDRLKKDVPQAYQEQSSAHPYLPFFHRLEACLKQMANYDPEEDDVICLDSDSEDEEDVKVVEKKKKKKAGSSSSSAKSSSTDVPKSSAVKKRILKREREGDTTTTQNGSTVLPPYKRGKSLENIVPLKIEKQTENNGDQREIICLDSSSDEEEEDDNKSQQILTLVGGLESPSQTPQPYNNSADTDQNQWRCSNCSCWNASNVLKCSNCREEEENEADELAKFLSGGFMDDANF